MEHGEGISERRLSPISSAVAVAGTNLRSAGYRFVATLLGKNAALSFLNYFW